MNFYGKVPKGFPFVGFPTVSIGKGQSKATQTDDLKGTVAKSIGGKLTESYFSLMKI